MDQIQKLYLDFLKMFPTFLQPFVSIALAALFIYSVFQTIKRNFIWLILLVIMLPASIPILKGVFQAVVTFAKFLFHSS